MASNIWDSVSAWGTTVGKIFGKKGVEPAYEGEVTKSSTYTQKQGSNMLLYLGVGAVVIMMVMFMKK